MTPEERKELNVRRYGVSHTPKERKICACGRTFYREGDQCSYCYSKGEGNRARSRKHYRQLKEKGAYNTHNWKAAGIGDVSELYDRLLEKQGGKCAICGAGPNGKRLALDHNHDTGEIRGLLCFNCNIALGYLKDKPDRAAGAAVYLCEHTPGCVPTSLL